MVAGMSRSAIASIPYLLDVTGAFFGNSSAGGHFLAIVHVRFDIPFIQLLSFFKMKHKNERNPLHPCSEMRNL